VLLKEEELCICGEIIRLLGFVVALLEAWFSLSMNVACSSVNSVPSVACRSLSFNQRW